MRKLKQIILIFIGISLSSASACSRFSKVETQPQGVKPGFELIAEDAYGTKGPIPFREASITLVNFWATWCAPCIHELPQFQALENAFSPEEFQIITVAVFDEPHDAIALLKRMDLELPVLFDREGRLLQSFGFAGVPATLILNDIGEQITFRDPESGELVDAINEPRDWQRKPYHSLIRELVSD